ncbi:hypothetical protein M2158_008350 [Streptomyces sp. SAI-144]|uniref:hypothetical protein n=1 Tax=unclassified Streptomyces TaxID=2593676 RepID=UPI0024769C3B|nr:MULTISPECIES: hypothetical protein [unclassified Streptomyces]MDH6439809.1 hypothetical protein [Streptomyces sp. SAI-144]MDH6487096.1 hypothetical protein [Streptomyces sp. SAI-127]
MNVLSCVACGSRLTEPVRRLDEMPEYPGWDGLPDPDGRRHGPPSVPRGTYVVDPQPFGAPFEPIGPDEEEEYDGIVPGGMWMSDERGFLVAAGPRGTYVLHPDDVVDLVPHPDLYRLIGCCGPDGRAGINHVCVCGAEVAIVAADCTSRYETRLVPDAVRPQATA